MTVTKPLYCFTRNILLILSSSLLSCSGNLSQAVLFEDGFDELPTGIISPSEGPVLQYHYIKGAGQVGEWTVSAFGPQHGFGQAWEIVQGPEGNYLRQNYHAVTPALAPAHPYIHPVIVAGDSIWHDYKIEFSFSPGKLLDKCGVIFKYQDNRSYYFYGMDGNMLVLKMVQHATAPLRPFEKVLFSTPFNWQAGNTYRGDISINQNRIYTLLNDSLSMVATDQTYVRGKVGFLSDVPAAFYELKVTTLNREKRKINRYLRDITGARTMRINENATPVVWKKISTEGFGAGRNIRFGDLNGDGETDLLIGQVRQLDPEHADVGLSCLTAMTFDGEILWQKGSPDPENVLYAGDVAFQVHDFDGDGMREVIYAMNSWINVVDGKTGKLLRRVRTPLAMEAGSTYERIPGDAILFCDVSGKGRDSDLLIKDHDTNIWLFDEHLKPLWKATIHSGRYPFAYDTDGDGRDEIAAGYSLLDDDGSVIWTREATTGGSAEAVTIAAPGYPQDSSLRMIYGAGDWGTMILDMEGKVLKHKPLGYIQHAAIGNFRSDLPGLEMVTGSFWGNQGILQLYDAEGNVYHSFEPGPPGSMCLPVNWKGDGEEYIIMNTNPGDGGMYNGMGKLAVAFPDDGHPELCNAVIDLTGDDRDEIITWDQNSLWVYTQDDPPRQGRVYHPRRNPLYNASNYQFIRSMPGWSE
jgi:hypothetical protein